MSIALEISRLQSDRNSIRTKLIELGLATSNDNLDKLAEAISTIVNKGAISATVQEGDTYTIPAGYHNGSGTVSGIAGGGNYTLQAKKATPTKKQQVISPDSGYYGLSSTTIEPIPDAYQDTSSVTATAGDVLSGKIFVTSTGDVITGTIKSIGSIKQKLDVTSISYTVPKGYHSGTGTVSIVLEQKTITPTKVEQKITPTTGKVLSEVTVGAIPANYIDTTDSDAIASDILIDKTAYVGGVKITGTMANNGDTSQVIDGMTDSSVAIPSGYTIGGTVALSNSIETALQGI